MFVLLAAGTMAFSAGAQTSNTTSGTTDVSKDGKTTVSTTKDVTKDPKTTTTVKTRTWSKDKPKGDRVVATTKTTTDTKK